MAQIFGWNAWFVDEEGRGDVHTHLHQVSDHLNAALNAGFGLAESVEVPIQGVADNGKDVLHLSATPEISVGAPIAYADVPLILILRFTRN